MPYNGCMKGVMVWILNIRRAGEYVLDAIIPRKARSVRTQERTIAEIPLVPTTHDLLGTQITTLMDYRDLAVRDLIQSLKYDGSGHAAQLAASVLADYLREEIASARAFSQKKILIVPVPLHALRARERGFNQIELALARLPTDMRDGGIALLAPTALTRIRPTPPQTRLSRSERLSNVAGAFHAPEPESLKRSIVFLIDDVTTTGATLVNARTPLKRAGAEVHLIALARA